MPDPSTTSQKAVEVKNERHYIAASYGIKARLAAVDKNRDWPWDECTSYHNVL
ncbi:MAG: hypothetical protein ACYDGO_03435 [Smithellaceae bacterium]